MPAYEPILANVPLVNRDSNDGVIWGNTLILNSTGTLRPIAQMAEIKGGLHYVEFLEYLQENSYRGIAVQRRELGMLVYVEKQMVNTVETPLGKYYKLDAISGTNTTWSQVPFGSTTVTVHATYPVANIASRDALLQLTGAAALVAGDIAVVSNAAGDTTVTPALVGSASYVYTGNSSTPWVRLLFPDDPRLAKAHDQNTDTQLVAVYTNGNQAVTGRNILDHLNDTSVHHVINDANTTGSVTELYSSSKINTNFIKKNPAGDPLKFFNELGNATVVQAALYRITGGVANSTYL